MKQIFKKVSSLCTVLLMMAVLTLTGVSSVWAADEVDDTVKQTLVTTAEGLTDTIIALSDEDIENYTKSSDEFTVGAMTAWAGSKDEVGALKERTGETEVKASDDGYTVTVPVSFEKADANFVYIFDASTGAPTSLTVDVQYSMAETLRRAVMNTIMGIAIVFIVLIFLSFLIDLLLAVNRPYGKSDYIPCICWGRNARYASAFEVGGHVLIWGRIQSREYMKRIGENETQKRIAYEVSVSKLEYV